MNIAIIGCGSIGNKRLKAIQKQHKLIAAVDLDLAKAQQYVQGFPQAIASTEYSDIVRLSEIDAVIVATTHEWLVPITLAAIQAGKHVFVEKPGARNAQEFALVIAAARNAQVYVHIGFNHRYHPALQKAYHLYTSGLIGDLLFIRGCYGHGGRVGYEQEWRLNKEVSGGGELLDQGVHLIDLAHWFLGNFTYVSGYIATYYWNSDVEDNAFLLLQTTKGQVAWLHASCTEWKNHFSFEIYGTKAKIAVQGLGGSYGVERLSYFRVPDTMGPPETTIWEYPGEDCSWQQEFDVFVQVVSQGEHLLTSVYQAKAVLDIVQKVYRENAKTTANGG